MTISNIWRYLQEEIREDLVLESELLLLSFSTGIQDAASWADYGCFASNQTGNMLLIAIAAADTKGSTNNLQYVSISLGAFIAGGLIMGQLGHMIGPRRRIWLFASSGFQTGMIYAASAIQYALNTQEGKPAAAAVMFLLAFASGAQVALCRSLKITDITTAMATAAFIDVISDPSLLEAKNRKRNRRVLFLLLLAAGCIVGAFSQKVMSSAFSVLLSSIGKTLVTFLFLLNRPLGKDHPLILYSTTPEFLRVKRRSQVDEDY